ncbi:MAG: hypothetical protein P8Q91_03755, partial [Porticoccaceae bacterium]|nr:hypothetical protein [Porticoccaceae bacterium]
QSPFPIVIPQSPFPIVIPQSPFPIVIPQSPFPIVIPTERSDEGSRDLSHAFEMTVEGGSG